MYGPLELGSPEPARDHNGKLGKARFERAVEPRELAELLCLVGQRGAMQPDLQGTFDTTAGAVDDGIVDGPLRVGHVLGFEGGYA